MGSAGDPREEGSLPERALAGVALAVAVLDLDGRFLHANRACRALLGRDEAALRATDCLALTADEDRERHHACLRRLRNGDIPGFAIEMRYRMPRGTPLAVFNEVTPLRDGTGLPDAFVAVARRRHPPPPRAGGADLDAAVSHRVRTPLTVVQAGLGLLASSAGARLLPAERALLASVGRNAARLVGAIDDLLALQQWHLAAAGREVVPLDLRDVVREALRALGPTLDRRHQGLVLELDEPLPVLGDAHQLRQAVLSIVHAAHRAAPPAAQLAVRGRDAGGEVALHIRAGGAGATVGEDGDLGLAVARGILELHEGRLRAERGVPPALSFTITLPRGAGTREK